MDAELQQLKTMIEGSRRIAFLGGAGVSTESGIPDFRGRDGLYRAIEAYGYPPETILSHEFFFAHTDVFFDYYKKHLLYRDAEPNNAHRALAKLEADGKLTAVVTQNIDGLHGKAGSKTVLELHGSVYRNFCLRCHKFHPVEDVLRAEGVPRCACGGVIKPDVVLYGEGLDDRVVSEAVAHISRADMLIIGGTSLTVYPASGLVNYFRGDRLAVINLSETHQDARAALTVQKPIGEALSFLL